MYNADYETTHTLYADNINDSRWHDIIQEELQVAKAEREWKEMNNRVWNIKDSIKKGVKRVEEEFKEASY